jgi:hypothetical protein
MELSLLYVCTLGILRKPEGFTCGTPVYGIWGVTEKQAIGFLTKRNKVMP